MLAVLLPLTSSLAGGTTPARTYQFSPVGNSGYVGQNYDGSRLEAEDATSATSIPVIHEGFHTEGRDIRPITPIRQPIRGTLELWVAPKPSPVKSSVYNLKSSTHSVKGVASWYCSVSQPICHYAYPPGSMVAAACGKLRAAMGSHWRGKYVTVAGNNRSVVVRLVDWCGSTTKLIDLYYEPMHRLGGTGTLPVRVSW